MATASQATELRCWADLTIHGAFQARLPELLPADSGLNYICAPGRAQSKVAKKPSLRTRKPCAAARLRSGIENKSEMLSGQVRQFILALRVPRRLPSEAVMAPAFPWF